MQMIDVIPQPESAMNVIRDYWNIALRRKWLVASAVALCLGAAWLYCMVSPKLYRSETLILVEEQKIPESYVQGVVEHNLEQRLFVIQKEILSRPLLTEIVNEFQLYPAEIKKDGIDSAVNQLANAIRVELLANPPRGSSLRAALDAFTISVIHEDPGTAMLVASRIASKFIEQNVKSREEIAEGTSQFLDSEVLSAQRELENKEDEISQFKATHMGELPQQIEANLRALDRLQSELNTVNENMQRLSDRLALVKKGIEEYKRFGRTNVVLGAAHEPDPLFRRLGELREKLAKLRAEFWDRYPDVVVTKDELLKVEQELVEVYGPDVIKPGQKPLDPYLQDLRKQESELKSELAVLKGRQRSLYEERTNYVKRVDRAPAVEQELLILQRDYENMKNNYRALLDKRLNARVAENLEKRQQGAQFRIIDPANFPRAPEKPNRRFIMLAALMFGLVGGFFIAVTQEQLNPQFRYPEDIERVLGPQVLAMIPDFRVSNGRPAWSKLLPASQATGNGINGDHDPIDIRALTWKRLKAGYGTGLYDDFVVKTSPASLVAEQYRVAATRLASMRSKERSTIVTVSSAVKGEGKTTTVINLGYTLARDLGKRTVLIDCDFKCSGLQRYAETTVDRGYQGLADCLRDRLDVQTCLMRMGDAPCWILPVGNADSAGNELLRTERLASTFEELREKFDYILVNSPPILPLADMNVLAAHADILLLVVRAGSTPRRIVRHALNTLKIDMPVHVILNAVGGQLLPYYMTDYRQPAHV